MPERAHGRGRRSSGPRQPLPGWAALALSATLTVLACSESEVVPVPGASATEVPAASRGPVLDPSALDAARWVTIYDPSRATNGYTLDFYRRRVPILFDMNGRIVHAWPRARVKSRLRLLADGSLLGIALGRGVVEYDWDGRLVWEFRLERGIPHHDVIRLASGNTLLVVRRTGRATDDLLEVTRAGEAAWEWCSAEHLGAFLGRARGRGDLTHINSVQELPPNPWWRRGEERFRPGNLLVSARNLNLVFVVDRQTGEVVWTFDEGLDYQHEALMIGEGLPGGGNILIFNNAYHGGGGERGSTILELNPAEPSVVWRYGAESFYSPTGGAEQPLPNGNVLVSSSRGGRVFEVTRAGETVWEWVPPFDPSRPHRYPYDYCPQLAALARPREARVRPPADYRHVDRDLYRFARRGGRRTVEIEGRKRQVLKSDKRCAAVIVPAAARLDAAYGLDRERIPDGRERGYAVRFSLRLRSAGSAEEIELLADTVDISGAPWRTRSLALDRYAHQRVQLCVASEAMGAALGEDSAAAFWGVPSIEPAGAAVRGAGRDEIPDSLTTEEAEARKQHLEALGYVD